MQIGDRVQFRPTHQKELLLTGTIRSIEGDSVVIESDAVNGSVSRAHAAHAADVQLLEEEKDGHEEAQESEAQEPGAIEADGEIYSQAESDSETPEKVRNIRHKKRA